MSTNAFLILQMALQIVAVSAAVIAIFSFAGMLLRWRTPQRKRHVKRLLLSLVVVPCCIGLHLSLLYGVYLPALGREQLAKIEAHRATELARTSRVHVGERAPQFSLTDADGATFSVTEANGKVVVINFFATWCGPCQMELPHVEEIWQRYRNEPDFELLVIGREETAESVSKFRESKGFSFPIAADPDRGVFSLFASESIPRTLVLSPDGVVVYSSAGFVESDLEKLEDVLAQQLGQLQARRK